MAHLEELQHLAVSKIQESRYHHCLDREWQEPYLNAEEITQRLRNVVEQRQLPERQELGAKQFLIENDLRAAGRNPDHPFDR
jgi:hypothetical protein